MKLSDLTPRAQQVMALAREEAGQSNRPYVGTGQLLLGLIAFGKGICAGILKKHGLDLETVRGDIEHIEGRYPEAKFVGGIPFTPRIKEVLARSRDEATRLGHKFVGTEHILLGLLGETEGTVYRIFQLHHLDVEGCRNEIFTEMKLPGPGPAEGGDTAR